jgi:pyruvate kinase
MLSEETALSKSCIKILDWLIDYRNKIKSDFADKAEPDRQSIISSIISKLNNQTIVVFSKKGYAVESINKINENINIILFSDNKKLIKISSLRRNVQIILTKKFDNKNLEKFIFQNIKKNKKLIFKNSNNIVIIRIIYPISNSRANNISIVNHKNFL